MLFARSPARLFCFLVEFVLIKCVLAHLEFICFSGCANTALLMEMCICRVACTRSSEMGYELPVLKCDVKRMYMCHLVFVADTLRHQWWRRRRQRCVFYMGDMVCGMHFEMPTRTVEILGE